MSRSLHATDEPIDPAPTGRTRERFGDFTPDFDRPPAAVRGTLTVTVRQAPADLGHASTIRAQWQVDDPRTGLPRAVELTGTVDWSTGSIRLTGTLGAGPESGAGHSGRSEAPVRPGSEPGVAGRLGLTRREREVAALLARGEPNAVVAERLGISPHTARRHTESVMLKLGARTRGQVGAILHGDVAAPRWHSALGHATEPALRRAETSHSSGDGRR